MNYYIPIVVSVSDKYLWCLYIFSYLFNKYWDANQTVIVQGYTRPQFRLPDNFIYISTDTYNYPKEKWVDGFLKFLNMDESGMKKYDMFVLFLEDYWLCRSINKQTMNEIADFCINIEPDTLRFDLTSDRLYAGGVRDYKRFCSLDIIEAPQSQYQMSLQAGLWNKHLLIEVLSKLNFDKHSAWDVELEGTGIVNNGKYKVYGSRQNPVRYCNAMNNTVPGVNTDLLNEEDKMIVAKMMKEVYK